MTKEKQGVLLVNLGSPDSTKVGDVRKYLREFLMDKRVIDVPYILRFFLVNVIIAPFRAKKSAEAYRKIWWQEGSPLKVLTERLAVKVGQELEYPIEVAMRYAQPSIYTGIENLYSQGVREVIIIPLYPQYAMSTTETVVDKCKEVQKEFEGLNMKFDTPFYQDPKYIECLVAKINKELKEPIDALLFSYHGIPERHIYKTDDTGSCEIGSCCFQEDRPSFPKCYRHQCYKTTELCKQSLDLGTTKVYQSFQSRLGRDPWLQPYTDEMLEKLPAKGKKRIAVLAPAFVADCLETLEEIAMEGKEKFLESGGEEFYYIPCLNDEERWAKYLSERVKNLSK